MAIYRGAGGSGDATTDASNQASVATTKANEATVSATNAANSATSAATSATTATTQATTSTTQATNAATSATNAANSATAASTSATNAANSATTATTQATNAATSATNAAAIYGSVTDLNNAVTAAATSATTATTQATNAATSATSAASGATTATTQAAIATTKATEANTSATNAATSATSASNSATSAASSATTATTQASTATTKASEASTSATNAANSATAAATSATNAATSETNAATSATTASTGAATATTQATTATTQATNAATSATSAATSATNAANSYDAFDDRYLGSKATAPTLDNDGNALLTGAIYWNSAANQLYVWTGSAWNAAAFDTTGGMVSLTGVETLTNKTITSPVIDSGTANGITYLNASKVLTSGSALTFDGTHLTFGATGNITFGTANSYINHISGNVDTIRFSSYSRTDIYSATAVSFSIGAEQMRLTSTGLGIGTTSPLNTLHIRSGGNTFARIDADAGGYAGLAFTTANTINWAIQRLPSSTDLQFNDGVANRITFQNGGNVGIGTSSPGAKLDVQGKLRLYDSSVAGFTIEGVRTSDGFQFGEIGMIYSSNNGSHFVIKPRLDNGAVTERLRVTQDGNVGIGTSTPIASLSISKQTTALSGTGNSYGLYMYPTSSGLTYIDALTNSTSNTALAFRTYNNGTYHELRLNSSGNLLVGTQTATSGGGVLQLSSGITFPATQVASANANTLDDYEQGIFTPTLGGIWTTSPTGVNGSYVKIGKQVYVRVFFDGPAAKDTSISGWIDGLPFPVIVEGTGSGVNSNVDNKGNVLFANTSYMWLTDTSFPAGAYYFSGIYLAAD